METRSKYLLRFGSGLSLKKLIPLNFVLNATIKLKTTPAAQISLNGYLHSLILGFIIENAYGNTSGTV